MQNYKRSSVKLNEYFKDNIKLSFISTRSVIIITKKDDKFYEFNESFFNNHRNSMMVLTSDVSKIKSLIESMVVEELCNINIVDVKTSSLHKIARTVSGQVYCWGKNCYGVLGNGGCDYNLSNDYKPEISHFLIDKPIIDIKCGNSHTLVLTSNWEIYAWGENVLGQIGNGREDRYQSTPYHINFFGSERMIAISCGYKHSMALTESGHVYSWGCNDDGELGLKSSSTRVVKIPTLIEIENVTFKKICCGLDYSLLLSSDGDIYVFGSNIFGQLGTGDDKNHLIPTKIVHSEKFVDIATHYNVEYISISCAQSESGSFYVWGRFEENSEIIKEPKESEYKSFNEIIAHYFYETYNSEEGPIIELLDDTFTKIDNYEESFYDEEYIGRGAFGKVFKVKDKKDENDIYAIKKIVIATESKDDLINQLKELDMISWIRKLHHERIIQYINVWFQNYYIENGVKIEKLTLYIQMEYCDKNLEQIIDEIKDENNKDLNLKGTHFLKPLGYYFVIEIFIQIIEGLNYFHKQNPQIIHRDLKPANIMLTLEDKYGFVKLGDYGLVTIHRYAEPSKDKAEKEYMNQSKHTTDIGDLSYAAPEVLDGEEYDTKADIYSIGRVLLDLFFIDRNSYENDEHYRNEMKDSMPKYHKIIHLWDQMLNELPTIRPDCEKILENKLELNLAEFDAQKEFEDVLRSYGNKNSYLLQLLKRVILFEIPVIKNKYW